MARARAPLTLDDLAATRPSPAPHISAQLSESGKGADGSGRTRRGQTLRLEPEAWRQLKLLAIEQGATSHDLLIQAVNMLFAHYDKPTIAA